MSRVTFTQDTAARIIRATRKSERSGPNKNSDSAGPANGSPSFWVELDAMDASNPGRYAWHLTYFDPPTSDFKSATPAVSSNGLYTAWEANKFPADLRGRRVLITHSGYATDNTPVYTFLAPFNTNILYITGNRTANGTYNGSLYVPRTDLSSTTINPGNCFNSSPSGGPLSVIVLNFNPLDQAGHTLQSGYPVSAFYITTTTDKKLVYGCYAFGFSYCDNTDPEIDPDWHGTDGSSPVGGST